MAEFIPSSKKSENPRAGDPVTEVRDFNPQLADQGDPDETTPAAANQARGR